MLKTGGMERENGSGEEFTYADNMVQDFTSMSCTYSPHIGSNNPDAS